MEKWSDREARARFSELLAACQTQGPQIVTHQGLEVAVLLALKNREQLAIPSEPTLKALLMQESGRIETLVPERQARGKRSSAASN